MLKIFICLFGVFVILIASEILYRKKILRGEYLRKFVHISSGAFIASWPWLISWRAIQLIGLAMFAVLLYNHRSKILHVNGNIKRVTYGGLLFPVAVVICAMLTDQKIFFALAILHMALADGLAAVVGTALPKTLSYKVFQQTKTVYGSMAFWFISVFILGIGGLFAHNLIPFNSYVLLLITLPALLTVLENVAVMGLDNLVVPVVVVAVLNQTL